MEAHERQDLIAGLGRVGRAPVGGDGFNPIPKEVAFAQRQMELPAHLVPFGGELKLRALPVHHALAGHHVEAGEEADDLQCEVVGLRGPRSVEKNGRVLQHGAVPLYKGHGARNVLSAVQEESRATGWRRCS